RPLAVGLGITAGKSDLYRRVAMLLQHRRSLETRCPRWWTIGVATSAMALVLLAATFGDRADSRRVAGSKVGDRGPGTGERERPSAFAQASADERGDSEIRGALPTSDPVVLAESEGATVAASTDSGDAGVLQPTPGVSRSPASPKLEA